MTGKNEKRPKKKRKPKEEDEEISVISAREKQLLLCAYNKTEAEYPKEKLIVDLFEEQVVKTPRSIAVVYGTKSLTYQQLNEQANQLACYLQNRGVKKEILVAVYLERSLEMLIAILAILKAGGAFVPLDTHYPQERIRFILDDTQCLFILSEKEMAESLNLGDRYQNNFIFLSNLSDKLSQFPKENLSKHVKPDNLCYVIYTSGSTGQPKGVMIAHYSLVNVLGYINQTIHLARQDNFLALSSISFDISIAEIFLPLMVGACCVLGDTVMAKDPKKIIQAIEKNNITILQTIPTVWRMLFNCGWKNKEQIKILSGGEALSNDLVKKITENNQSQTAWNFYGPTETTIWSALCPIRRASSFDYYPIGRPIANTKILILNEELQMVPIGMTGELYISGVGLARGYLNRAELTKKVFIENLLLKTNDPDLQKLNDVAPRWYRTGDLAQWTADGNIRYVGRVDNQVKIRGFRIELEEIEAALMQHPAIVKSVVIAHDFEGEKKLIAYYTRKLSKTQTADFSEHLRVSLLNKLPAYMVPNLWIELKIFPTLPNGKIDKKSLPAPSKESLFQGMQILKPRDAIEEKLTLIWSQVLRIDSISINKNFFLLGGHSINAIYMLSRVNRLLGIDLPIKAIFENNTIEKLAHLIKKTKSSKKTLTWDFKASKKTKNLPLIAGQKRLFFLQQYESKAVYTIPFATALSGYLDIQALENSFQLLIHRHQALRACFENRKNAPVLHIEKAVSFNLTVEKLDKRDLAKTLMDEANKAFNLGVAPLMRVRLFQFNKNEYLLMIVLHHIISDGRSVELIYQELGVCYAAYLNKEKPKLAPLEMQYLDFMDWQNSLTYQEKIKSQLDYWKNKLACFSPLNMPADLPRPIRQSYRGACYRFSLDEDLVENIHALGIAHNVTLFMTVLAAFNILLSRYSSQEDIVVGTPMDNRDFPEAENVLGFFVNTLVLRHDLSTPVGFDTLLKQVKKNCLEAYTHQHLPFECLIDALKIERNIAYHPLFQVMFVWQSHAEKMELELSALKTKPILIDTGLAKFDLTFEFISKKSSLACHIEYSTDLYQENTIARMAGHLKQLLRAIVDNPSQSIHTLSLLTAEEQKRILLKWNCPAKPAILPQKIHDLFSHQARETPYHTALIYQDQRRTYQALDEKSTQWACLIQAYYQKLDKPIAAEGVFIALCVERSLDLMVGILAILKAGAAYVPLDPSLPKERLKFIIEDIDCQLILTQEKIKQKIPSSLFKKKGKDGFILCLDNKPFTENSVVPTHLPALQGTADLAYVIYTSGTTGKPKGVKQTHYNVQRLLAVTQAKFNFNAQDIWILFHSYMFDFSVWEAWGCLLHGGCLVIPSYQETRDPILFYQLVIDREVTVLNQTPSAFQAFIQEDQMRDKKLSKLRYVIFGGEALKVESLIPWWKKYGDIYPQLINMYGITETTVHITYKLLKQTDLHLPASIGKPLDDLSAYVVDKYFNLMPIGVPGELLIGNAGLAEGYLNRPELTSKKFIVSPFLSSEEKTKRKSAGEEIRLYRTGDLVRWLEDGSLEYLGRIDTQVKIHGFRIELGEIEAVLNKHRAIQQAIVDVVEHHEMKRLIAYYVIKRSFKKGDKGITADKLQNYLKKHLPNYMVPHLFIALEKIPLTSNMKLDAKALQQLATQNFSLKNLKDEQEKTKTEALLLEIWQKTLRISSIKVTDNFFRIGGDSMSSIRIVYAAREKKLHFTVSDIFQFQTIQKLAQKCDAQHENNFNTENNNIPPFSLLTIHDREKLPKNIEDAYPQVALQTGMLYHAIATPEAAVYLDVFTYSVLSPYVDAIFKQALDCIIRENPVLRTSFDVNEFEEPIQMVHHTIIAPITVTDLQHLSPEQQENALDAWMESEKLMPFDYKSPPLFRIGIHLLAESKFVFGFAFHHAILDGWSVATFLTKLLKKYASRVAQREPVDREARVDSNYKIFVQMERQAIASSAYKEFWKNELTDFQFTHIMPWFGEKQKDLVGEVNIPVSDALSRNLQLLAKQIHVSLDIVLIAAHIKLLSLLSNSDDITTGLVFNGRPEIENSEKTLGLFLNSLPFRQKIVDCSWKEFILSVSAKKIHLYPYRHYPLQQICEDIGSKNLFNILFYFTNFHVYQELDKESNIRLIARKLYERTNFPLVFEARINQGDSSLSCILRYQGKIYSRMQIKVLAQYYKKILQAVVNDVDALHQRFNLLMGAEKDKILYKWNNTEEKYPKNTLAIDLFEGQAKKHPNNTAIIFSDSRLTYRQLDKKANQIALYLHQRGVKKDTIVAVHIESGLETIIAILAIMKAGGAYLPLDLSYPKERIEFMLDDTACQFILTEKQTLAPSALPKRYSTFFIFLSDIFNETNQSSCNIHVNRSPCDLAYIIYTSGSTGEPKGVMVEQHSLINLLFYMREKIKLSSQDNFLALSSICFDNSIAELLLPLTVGACCVVGDRLMAKDPQRIIQTIKERDITIMQATATFWRMLFDYGWRNSSNMKILSSGEALLQDLVKKIMDHSLLAWNLYGPTETTIWSSLCPIQSNRYNELDYYPIGRPIANTKMFVLNKNNQLNPIGVTGELYISGSGLARAYLNKPELTKERFIENLFLMTDESEPKKQNDLAPRLYRTGDLAQWLPDGNLRYIGRMDDQVKIRGYRIEPGEIEFVLLQHKKIKQCAVIIKKNHEQAQLIAYIVLHEGYSFENQKELNDDLKKKLPYFMVPEKIFIMDCLPVNSNGKVDKKQLAHHTMPELLPMHAGQYLPPVTPEQIHLATVWSEILHCDKISLDDDFFDLGGNSISTLKMMTRVEKDFGISLSLHHIIEFSTLEKLSTKILSLKNNKGSDIMQDTISFTKKIPNPVVVLQDKGNKTPLFLIHPVGGGLFYYLPLVKELGDERPVYGIQDPGIEAQDLLFANLQEMASFYIVAIKRYQAKGPYFIAGSSFGANAAVEMARQLTDQGESLAFIGLIDGIAKYPDEVIKNRDVFDKNLKSQIPYLHDQLPDIVIPDLLLELHWHRQQIMAEHKIPNLTDLKLTLFKAMEIMDILKPTASDFNLWDCYHPELLDVYKVSGDHLTMHFEPHVQNLAKALKECLNKAEALCSV